MTTVTFNDNPDTVAALKVKEIKNDGLAMHSVFGY